MPQEVHIHSLVQEEHQSLAHQHEPSELHIRHVHVVQQAGAKCGHLANHAHVLRCFDSGQRVHCGRHFSGAPEEHVCKQGILQIYSCTHTSNRSSSSIDVGEALLHQQPRSLLSVQGNKAKILEDVVCFVLWPIHVLHRAKLNRKQAFFS